VLKGLVRIELKEQNKIVQNTKQLTNSLDDRCFCFSLSGDRDGKDPLLGDGVRKRRRGLRLSRVARPNERKGSKSKIQTGTLTFKLHSSIEDRK